MKIFLTHRTLNNVLISKEWSLKYVFNRVIMMFYIFNTLTNTYL